MADLLIIASNGLIHHSQHCLFKGPSLRVPQHLCCEVIMKVSRKTVKLARREKRANPSLMQILHRQAGESPKKRAIREKAEGLYREYASKRGHLGSMCPSRKNRLDQSIQKQIPQELMQQIARPHPSGRVFFLPLLEQEKRPTHLSYCKNQRLMKSWINNRTAQHEPASFSLINYRPHNK